MMPSDKKSVEDLIQDYLFEEGILKDKLNNAKFEFGFKISFQPGKKSQNLSIYKPKNMNSIFITVRFQIPKETVEIINSYQKDKKNQLFDNLRKYLLTKEVFYKFDLQNFIIEIHEQIYPDSDDYLSKNSLFKLIQKVFHCFIFSNLLIDEFCKGKNKVSPEFGLFF